MGNIDNIKALFIIVNAGFANDVAELAYESGASGATILNARGEGAHHKSILGITVDTEKDIVVCIADAAISERIMNAVKENAGIKTPAHGICFTLPVDKAVGLRA